MKDEDICFFSITDEDLMKEEMMDAQKHDDKLREIWEERRNNDA